MKKWMGVFLMLVVVLAGSQVFATTLTFTDGNNYYWTGWNNRTSDDSQDVIGNPNIIGGTATVSSNGYLTGLTFNVTGINPTSVVPGDLFIDSDGDGSWNFVVNLLGSRNFSTIGFATGDNTLYSVINPLSLNSSRYTLSYASNGNIANYREYHPVAYNISSNLTQVSTNPVFTGWSSTTTPTFSFGAQDILLGSQFNIGWTQQCANDVFYGTLNNPVPEPASMLLLGSGLIGLAGWGRRRFFKKGAVAA